MKYFGRYFQVNSCRIDIKQQIRKFYGNFNNIMSVLGRGQNEMAAGHLVNCYCVPTLTYACENWNLTPIVITALLVFSGIMPFGVFLTH